ncbi:MAG: hypothetical protein A2X32_10425 [Elusimicrobia bacterium GWC2_64_44]|nr:MAG: hypothetical protein A2X32_10425 [Elusimicrobia bacterium GWC2_64_44]
MNDLDALLPILLALAITAGPIAAGIALRRKFSPDQKTGRLIGTLLLWCGIIAGLLMMVFALHYKGMFL